MQQDIHKKRFLLFARWFFYTLLLIFAWVLHTNQSLCSMGGIRPLWLAALCLTVAAYENSFPSAIFGIFAGLLWDASAGTLSGFHAGCMLIGCFLISGIIQLWLRRTFFNAAALSLVWLILVTGVEFLFSYVLFNIPQRGVYFWGTVIPTVVYTVAVSTLLYPICGLISRLGREE